jgi:hypothetical protein
MKRNGTSVNALVANGKVGWQKLPLFFSALDGPRFINWFNIGGYLIRAVKRINKGKHFPIGIERKLYRFNKSKQVFIDRFRFCRGHAMGKTRIGNQFAVFQ